MSTLHFPLSSMYKSQHHCSMISDLCGTKHLQKAWSMLSFSRAHWSSIFRLQNELTLTISDKNRGFSWDFNQQYLDMGSLKSQSPACSPCTLQKSLYCCRFCRLCGLWKTSQWVQNNKLQHFYYFVSLLHLVFLILNNNFCNPAVFDSCSCSAALLFKNVYHNLPLVFCEISNSANNLPL